MQLNHVADFTSRDLTESTEMGANWLGRLIIGLQQLLAETEYQVVIGQLQTELPDFMEVRPLLIDLLRFMEKMAPEDEVRQPRKFCAPACVIYVRQANKRGE